MKNLKLNKESGVYEARDNDGREMTFLKPEAAQGLKNLSQTIREKAEAARQYLKDQAEAANAAVNRTLYKAGMREGTADGAKAQDRKIKLSAQLAVGAVGAAALGAPSLVVGGLAYASYRVFGKQLIEAYMKCREIDEMARPKGVPVAAESNAELSTKKATLWDRMCSTMGVKKAETEAIVAPADTTAKYKQLSAFVQDKAAPALGYVESVNADAASKDAMRERAR